MSVALYTPSSSQIVHEARVDFRQRVIQPMIHIVQYDKSLPIVAVELYSDGQKWALPDTVATVKVRWGKRDHTYVYTDVLGCNADRTVVYIEIIEQMTVFYGEHNPVLEVTIGDTLACSSYIPFYIDRNPIQKDDIVSEITPSIVDVLMAAINSKQDQLVSGTNIKTINGESLLGSGDIVIQGGGGGSTVEAITTYDATVAGYTALVGLKIGDNNYRLLPLGEIHGQYSISIGILSKSNNDSVSIGQNADSRNGSVAIGHGAEAKNSYSSSVGLYAIANSQYCSAFGSGANCTGNYSVAIGFNAKSIGAYSVALGAYSVASIANVVSIFGHVLNQTGQVCSTLLLRDPEKIFFANEDSTTTTDAYTALSSFTNGKTLKDYLDAKQATLVAGTNITLLTNQDGTVTINASGGTQVPMGTMYGTGDLAIGSGSVAGVNNNTHQSTAYGTNASAASKFSVAIGYNAKADVNYTVSIGHSSKTTSSSGVAIGYKAQSLDDYSVGIGYSVQAVGKYSISIGGSSSSHGKFSTAIGNNASVGDSGWPTRGQNSIAIGYSSKAVVQNWVSFDGLSEYIRTLTAFDPAHIFFRNEAVDPNKLTQAAYTNGHTLADYMFAYATDAEIEAIFN